MTVPRLGHEPPIEALSALSPRSSSLSRPGALALIVHLAFAEGLEWIPPRPVVPAARSEMLMIDPPLAEPLPQPPAPTAEPAPESKAPQRSEARVREPTPAAQAAAVIAHEVADESADFTDAVVAGSATRYVGGSTSPSGVSTTATRASAVGSGRAPTSSPPALQPDRSRAASATGSLDWNCAFPVEADVAGIDRALVKLRVRLDASGTPVGTEILSDPGHGFARAARRCALERRYRPALDRSGLAQPAALTLGIRFVR